MEEAVKSLIVAGRTSKQFLFSDADLDCPFRENLYYPKPMNPFVLRYVESPKLSPGEVVELGTTNSNVTIGQLANKTGTKTLTEVRAESGDKDRTTHSCRAFQLENV
jgi:hypothetical protein